MRDITAQGWRELSVLYDEAQALPSAARSAWLASMEAAEHPQWRMLLRMLSQPEALLQGGYLLAPPALDLAVPHGAGMGGPGGSDAGHLAGDAVGAYRLIRPLGAGGMAEVWLAERADGAFVRQLALKLLQPQLGASRQQAFRRRFEREHRILATLRHPHIAALHDAGITPDGQHWLALEFVDGQPMDAWCDAQRLDVHERVRLFRQVLYAVSHAHARLVLHRDLKPSNVLVTADGQVRLLDFGIATLLEPESESVDATNLTQMAGRPMTPRYASPEQLQGLALDATSDVYSLGIVLYELLCGAWPYKAEGTGVRAIERAVIEGEAVAPSQQRMSPEALGVRRATLRAWHRSLAPDLDAIVLRATAKRGAERYGSVDALAAELDRWLAGEPVLARRPSPAARAVKFARRHAWGTGLGALSAAALAGVASVAVLYASQARDEAARARAATGFMLRLFGDTDPDRHGGVALTPAQLLARGRGQLGSAAAGAPLLQADLLAGIAQAQYSMGEHEEAENSYAQWAGLLQLPNAAPQLAQVLALRAQNDVRRGNFDAARAGLAQSEVLRPGVRAEPLLRARRDETRGWIARHDGRLDETTRAFDDALQAALVAGTDNSDAAILAVDLRLAIAQHAAERGDAAKALAALDAVSSAGPVGPGPRGDRWHELALTRAVVWDRLAEYNRISQTVPADLAQCEQDMATDSEICRKARRLLMRALMRQGRVDELWILWPTLWRLVDGRGGESERMSALQVAHRVAWQAGDAAAQAASQSRLAGFVQAARSGGTRVRAALALAEGALYQGQPDAAFAHIEQARKLAVAAKVTDSYLQAQIALTDGLCWQARGQHAEALAQVEAARSGFEQALGPAHPLVSLLGANRLPSLLALGRKAEAAALIDAALPVLQRSIGAASPVVRRLDAYAVEARGDAKTKAAPVTRFAPFG